MARWMMRVLVIVTALGVTPAIAQEGTPETEEVPPWIDIGNDLEFRYYFAESEFALYLLGEVRNLGEASVPAPSLSVTLLDEAGNIVGAQRLIDLYPVVEPEQPTPYQVVVDRDIAARSWDAEEVEVVGYGRGPAACSGILEVQDVTEETKQAYELRISGTVANVSGEPQSEVLVWVTIYRDSGLFAGMLNESIGTSIPADRSALFTIFGLGGPGLPADTEPEGFTYRVYATSWSGGTISC